MINKKTGAITISDVITVKHNDILENILLILGKETETIDHNNGWLWLKLTNVVIESRYLVFNLGFYHNRLKELSFVVNNSKFEFSEDWAAWSEQGELDNLERYKNWLIQELGTQRDFEWGNVWAHYDSKGGSSSIGIRYK